MLNELAFGNYGSAMKILKIRKSYDRIILPFLVKDSYHENLLVNDDDDLIKYMIFSSLSKCKDELIILCPSSKRKKFLKNLRKLNNVNIFGYNPRELFANVSLYIAPMCNPDGVDLVTGALPPSSESYQQAQEISNNSSSIPFVTFSSAKR